MKSTSFYSAVFLGAITVALLIGGVAPAISVAQNTSTTSVVSSQPQICSVVINMKRGSRGISVTMLQEFLSDLGYFHAQATGYFGPITGQAVIAFQLAGRLPGTGFFGPMTRGSVAKFHCQIVAKSASLNATPSSGAAPLLVSFVGGGLTGGSQYVIEFGDGQNSGPLSAIDVCMHLADGSGGCPRVATSHTYSANGSYTATLEPYIACLWSNPRCMIATQMLAQTTITVGVAAAPHITTFQPQSGPIGTSVTLSGSGFTSDMIVRFAEGSVAHTTSSDGTWISFTVPNSVGPYCAPNMMCAMYMRLIGPGQYSVYIQSADGSVVSNTVTFAVTGSSFNQTLSISGLDAPTTLSLGTSGTWPVHVQSSSTNHTLHYSVLWGDEANTTGGGIMESAPTTVKTSVTFTHAYQRSATYTPTFTVTDDSGHSVSTSATITITPLY